MNPYAQETHFVCAKHLRELGGSAPCCVCTRHSDGCSFEGTEEECCEKCQAECFRASQIAPNCYHDCPCHKISEEKKDWEKEYRKRIESSGWYGHIQTLGQRSLEEFIGSEIMFIEGLLEEERERCQRYDGIGQLEYEMIQDKARKEEQEKWRLKNAGLYRQLFAEMNPERTFTAKELWKIFDDYAPLFTEEQKEELRDNLNSIMK